MQNVIFALVRKNYCYVMKHVITLMELAIFAVISRKFLRLSQKQAVMLNFDDTGCLLKYGFVTTSVAFVNLFMAYRII